MTLAVVLQKQGLARFQIRTSSWNSLERDVKEAQNGRRGISKGDVGEGVVGLLDVAVPLHRQKVVLDRVDVAWGSETHQTGVQRRRNEAKRSPCMTDSATGPSSSHRSPQPSRIGFPSRSGCF